jgi:hypothetical protein
VFGDEEGPPFVYTAGLSGFGHPELIMFAISRGTGVDLPKSAPADVAGQALDAVESGQDEVLADDLSRRVNSGLAG